MKQNEILTMIRNNVDNQLKNGIVPWVKRYTLTEKGYFELQAISHQSGRPYSMLNQFILGYPGEYWTFEHVKKENLRVKKGAKAERIVFWRVVDMNSDKDKDEDLKSKHIPILKYYNVFHESDIEGAVPRDSNNIALISDAKCNPQVIVDTYLCANENICVIHKETTPCFMHKESHTKGIIMLPQKSLFESDNHYYAALFHEIVHSTRGALGRPKTVTREDYAREELVAEMGSARLCAIAGISSEIIIGDSSSYCATWMSRLKNDPNSFLWASSRAEKAVNFILGEKNVNESDNGGS